MCGCDCCQNSNPTCFDPQAMEAGGSFHGWACRCSCPGCIARVIDGAMAYERPTYVQDDGTHLPQCLELFYRLHEEEGIRLCICKELRDADQRGYERGHKEGFSQGYVDEVSR